MVQLSVQALASESVEPKAQLRWVYLSVPEYALGSVLQLESWWAYLSVLE